MATQKASQGSNGPTLAVIAVNSRETSRQIQKWTKTTSFKTRQGSNHVQRCMEAAEDAKSNTKKAETTTREVKKEDEKGETYSPKDVTQNCHARQVQGTTKKDLQARKKPSDTLQRSKKTSKVNNFPVFITLPFIFILCAKSLCVLSGAAFDISFSV